MSMEAYFALAGFLLALVGQIVYGVWFLARLKEELTELLVKKTQEIDDKYNKECGELHEKINTATQRFGETVAAIRQKIHEVEMWGRDHFAQKGDIEKDLDRIHALIENVGRNMQDSFNKLEKRIDRTPG